MATDAKILVRKANALYTETIYLAISYLIAVIDVEKHV